MCCLAQRLGEGPKVSGGFGGVPRSKLCFEVLGGALRPSPPKPDFVFFPCLLKEKVSMVTGIISKIFKRILIV